MRPGKPVGFRTNEIHTSRRTGAYTPVKHKTEDGDSDIALHKADRQPLDQTSPATPKDNLCNILFIDSVGIGMHLADVPPSRLLQQEDLALHFGGSPHPGPLHVGA